MSDEVGLKWYLADTILFTKKAVRTIRCRTSDGQKIGTWMAYLKLLADRRITLRNLNPKATYSTCSDPKLNSEASE
jgi:hypothetical protein